MFLFCSHFDITNTFFSTKRYFRKEASAKNKIKIYSLEKFNGVIYQIIRIKILNLGKILPNLAGVQNRHKQY